MNETNDERKEGPNEEDPAAPRDYEVGYGRPPKATQFQKGQSGNPKGRPKGKRGLKSDLRAELNEKVEITENGIRKRLTKQQLLIKQLFAKAIKGDIRALSKITDINITLFGPDDETPPASRKLAPDDAAILAAWQARQVEAARPSDSPSQAGDDD